MKTVFNYVIAGVFVVTLFIGVIRGAGFAMCNVDAYGFKADQVSLVFSTERGLTLSGTKTHVKQRFLPLTPLLMV
ncbi:hypothetical protein POX75_27295, partial [Klebsiella pneumoniae]